MILLKTLTHTNIFTQMLSLLPSPFLLPSLLSSSSPHSSPPPPLTPDWLDEKMCHTVFLEFSQQRNQLFPPSLFIYSC